MRRTALAVLAAVPLGVAILLLARPATSADPEPKGEFSSSVIDLGVVVSDLEKSAKFYTEAVGFREVKGFAVPAEFCADAGLTDGKPLTIRVFVLGDGPSATKLKLMEVPGTKKGPAGLANSQLGYRYVTIHINDTDAALKRIEKAGIKPVAKTPVALPDGFPKGVALTVLHDPDGNIVELVGPKKG